MKIGIYHIFEANRKALMKTLNNGSELYFEEIDDWKKMETSDAKIMVIFSPEFLPIDVSTTEFKNLIHSLNKTLIIVAHDIKTWKMNRPKTFYLDQPDLNKTIDAVKSILILEIMSKPLEYKKRPFGE